MEFIVDKRKDLSFIGPEFSSILNSDDEAKIHVRIILCVDFQEMEFEYPNIHTLVYKDFEKALEDNPNLTKIRSRGVELFKIVMIKRIVSFHRYLLKIFIIHIQMYSFFIDSNVD